MTQSPPQLDAMLLLTEAAEWLGMHRRTLLRKVKGRNPAIPAFRISRREYRFHPRTIIAKLAADAGVKAEVIQSSFGKEQTK